MSDNMIETKNFEKKELHKVLRDRSDETPRILGDRLNELEGAVAGILVDISAIMRTPSRNKENLDPLIDTLEEAQMLLIIINRLRKVCR